MDKDTDFVNGYEVGKILHRKLTWAGYHLEQTGGGCTAYCKPHTEIENSYFLITIAYQNDFDDWCTDAEHPIEWPVFIGFYVDDEYQTLKPSKIESLHELYIAEQVLVADYYNEAQE